MYSAPGGFGDRQLAHDHVGFRTFGVGGCAAAARMRAAMHACMRWLRACSVALWRCSAALGCGGPALQCSGAPAFAKPGWHQTDDSPATNPSPPPKVPGLGIAGLGAALQDFGFTEQPETYRFPERSVVAKW
jgi:hypothetical protein